MANLKRNMIELVKNPEAILKGEEPEIEKVWTPAFISLRVARNALDLYNELEEDVTSPESEKFDKLVDFVANEIYGGKITPNDIYDRLHAPGGRDALRETLLFVAIGQQSNDTKNFLAKKD